MKIKTKINLKKKEQFGILPEAYEQELNKRYKHFEENINFIQAAELNSEQRMMLQKFIENNFKESLQQSGEQRQLEYLSIMSSTSSQINSTAPH